MQGAYGAQGCRGAITGVVAWRIGFRGVVEFWGLRYLSLGFRYRVSGLAFVGFRV